MLTRKSRAPFSLYKKSMVNGPAVWYARFWDEKTERYAVTRSTGVLAVGKRERRTDAETIAREMVGSIKFPIKPRSKKALQEPLFLDYIEAFWTPDSSYVQERVLVNRKPLSNNYVKINRETLILHVRPFAPFKNLLLRELTPALLRDWRTWRLKTSSSRRRINAALQAMRVAVRYALERQELDSDPFVHVSPVSLDTKEKGVLTPQEVQLLTTWQPEDPRQKLTLLLAALGSMRRGEVAGLQWGDVDLVTGLIKVRHNYVRGEGLKCPKNGTSRTVPIHEDLADVLSTVRAISPFVGPQDYVIFDPRGRGTSVTDAFFRTSFDNGMAAAGMSAEEQKARNLTFHGLRHTFVTLGRLSGLTDVEIQALAGHRSSQMMEHYTHAGQVIDFEAAKKKLSANWKTS